MPYVILLVALASLSLTGFVRAARHGREPMLRAVRADFTDTAVTDADLIHLEPLKDLREVDFFRTKIKGSGRGGRPASRSRRGRWGLSRRW